MNQVIIPVKHDFISLKLGLVENSEFGFLFQIYILMNGLNSIAQFGIFSYFIPFVMTESVGTLLFFL